MRVFTVNGKSISACKPKNFDYEKHLHKLVEDNIEILFPDLKLLKHKPKIDSAEPDTLAFNHKTKSFVIIEYKIKKADGITDQGMHYYNLLRSHQLHFKDFYNSKNKVYQENNYFNWNKSKVFFIGPYFNDHQIKATFNKEFSFISIYTAALFQNNLLGITKLPYDTELVSTKSSPKHNSSNKQKNKLGTYTEIDYLNGSYGGSNVSTLGKELWNILKNTILETFDDVVFQQTKTYAKLYTKKNNVIICTLEARKSKVYINYASKAKDRLINASDFIRDVSNVGHLGLGHYRSELKNQDDIQHALEVVRRVYNFKTNLS